MSPHDPTVDLIAGAVEKLAAVQPDLTAELIELMARADASALLTVFGSKQSVPALLDKAQATVAAPLSIQPPPAPRVDRDEYIAPLSPDRPDRFSELAWQ